MPKQSKKKVPKPKGNSSRASNVVAHDFDEHKKNNPPFRIQMLFSNRLELNMILPFQPIPGKTFQCGLNSESLHHAAKEGIRSLLVNALHQVMDVDDSVLELLDAHIETCYSENTTGNDMFQFSLVGSRDAQLRFTFQAVTNFLAAAPTPTKEKPLTIACFAPDSILHMIETQVASNILDKPKDEFFDRARSFLPPNVVSMYDNYRSTPRKQRKFSRFSQSVHLDAAHGWNSPHIVHTALKGPEQGETKDDGVPAEPPISGGNGNRSAERSLEERNVPHVSHDTTNDPLLPNEQDALPDDPSFPPDSLLQNSDQGNDKELNWFLAVPLLAS